MLRMIEHADSLEERARIVAELRQCLERIDLIGEALAAIHVDHAINILESSQTILSNLG